MTTADASMLPPAGAVNFLGKEGAYWRLRIKGAALLVFTLGIYRFWLATDVRRYLWSNTEIAGDTLEYSGLATELLIGFLLAIAIVVPLYTSFAIVALAACVSCRSASGLPKSCRVFTCVTDSSKARRAKPMAAAPTASSGSPAAAS